MRDKFYLTMTQEFIGKLKKDSSLLFLLFFSMLYVTLKVVCNPLFFRQAEFNLGFIDYNVRLTCAAFVYSFIYVISDVIVVLSNRKTAIFIVLFGILCDGLFSYSLYFVSTIDIPAVLINDEVIKTTAVNTVGSNMWRLFSHGLLASIAAAIAEILIFAMIYKKVRSFFVSTIVSVITTLVAHNLINDYFMLKDDPHRWFIIINNLTINISIMLIYTIIVSFILTLRTKYLNRS